MDLIQNGELGSSVRAKLNEVISDVNSLNVDVPALQIAEGLSFNTVSDLLADTSLTYASGNVAAGKYVLTRSEGFSYLVASSSATDQHVTTAGGVKLYVQPDAEGWRPLQAFGAVGDGEADDTSLVQRALNVSLYLKGQPGAIYKCTAAVTIPSNITIDMNGARIRRGFFGSWVVRSTNAFTTWDNEEIHLRDMWIDDDGTTATRGNGLCISGDRITIDGYRNTMSAPNSGFEGAWATFVSGKDISIRRLWVDTEACGLYSDGFHAGYLENFTMTDFQIRAADDGIALHNPRDTFSFSGKNLPSKNIDIQGGFVSSVNSNGVRLGTWGSATEGVTPKNNVAWQNVNIDLTIGQCGTSCLELVDTRNTSEITAGLKNTDITIKARIEAQDDPVRVVNIIGNPDISDVANLGQRNYGRVRIDLDASADDTTSANLIRAGGFDLLEISGTLRYSDTAAPSQTHAQFLGGGTLVLDGVVTQGLTTGTFASFQRIENVVIADNQHLSDGNSEFQTFALLLTPEVDMSLYMTGGRITETARAINTSGTGNIKDFIIQGTILDAGNILPTFSTATWAAGGRFIFEPAGGYAATVATLFGSAVPVREGHRAFATNGRKSGEGSGAGTGQPVYRDGTDWRVFRDDSVVVA